MKCPLWHQRGVKIEELERIPWREVICISIKTLPKLNSKNPWRVIVSQQERLVFQAPFFKEYVKLWGVKMVAFWSVHFWMWFKLLLGTLFEGSWKGFSRNRNWKQHILKRKKWIEIDGKPSIKYPPFKEEFVSSKLWNMFLGSLWTLVVQGAQLWWEWNNSGGSARKTTSDLACMFVGYGLVHGAAHFIY